MLQLDYAYTRHAHRRAARPHMTALGLVGLLHVLLAAMFVNAIRPPAPVDAPERIKTDIRDIERSDRLLPPPPPPMRADLPTPIAPEVPRVVIDRPTGPSNAITEERVADPPIGSLPTPEVRFTPPRAIASTQTGPTYPPLSRRLREEGSVRLRLTVGTDGRVVAAEILESSGAARLDDAATRWVLRHWRYEPAVEGRMPVQATVEAVLRFELE